MTRESFKPSSQAIFLAFALGVLATFHGVLAWTGFGEGPQMVQDRVLLDTDSYMWMNRVIHIAEGGGWFEHTYPRINPPEGHVQHWTRPLDALLLVGGAALGLVWGFQDGLYFWGLSLSPLLHLATLLSLVWAVRVLVRRRLAERSRVPLLMLIFLAQIPIHQTFLVGRPDHHALMGLLFVLYLGFWMRVLLGSDRPLGAAVGLGLISALGIWVNVEALLYVTLGMVGLGVAWLLGNRRLARDGAVQALALVAGLTSGILLEWGPRSPPVREMDTLSVAHLCLMGFTAGFWILLWGVSSRGWAQQVRERLGASAVGAVAVLAPVAVLFPEFFGNPLGDVDALYRETRLTHIRELQTLPSLGQSLPGSAGAVILYAGTGLVALPYLVLRAWKSTAREWRVLWMAFAVAVALYLGLSLEQRRWTDYLALSAVIPFWILGVEVLDRIEIRFRGRVLRVLRLSVLTGLIVGPAVAGMGLMVAGEGGRFNGDPPPVVHEGWVGWQESSTLDLRDDHATDENGRCSLVNVGRFLSDREWFGEPELVMAHTDYGPELMYRTHHSVLSIPNHRPQPGYRFTHEVLMNPDPNAAASMLQEWEVGIVVLCVNDITSGFFRYPEVESPFVDWLAQGGVPAGYALHVATPVVRIYRRDRSGS